MTLCVDYTYPKIKYIHYVLQEFFFNEKRFSEHL